MTILLTGSTGFLGSHLKRRLLAAGHIVHPVGRGEGLPYESVGFDAVINCAANLDDPERMVASNLDLVGQWLDRARRLGIRRFIQIGSSSETGPVEGQRSETTFCRPSNLYEATKLAATNLCLGYAAQYDLDVVVARPFSLYGSVDKPRKLLPTLWNAFCQGRPIHVYPGGHDWTHVDDFVEGIMLLLTTTAPTKGHVYHFGTGISTSNAQVAGHFQRAVGSDLNVVSHMEPYHPYDVRDWCADSTKAQTNLGWRPTISVAEGVHRFVMESWFNVERL